MSVGVIDTMFCASWMGVGRGRISRSAKRSCPIQNCGRGCVSVLGEQQNQAVMPPLQTSVSPCLACLELLFFVSGIGSSPCRRLRNDLNWRSVLSGSRTTHG